MLEAVVKKNLEARIIHTYEADVDVFEARVMRCSYGYSALERIHGRIRSNDLAGTIRVIETDFNGWLAIVGNGPHRVGDLTANGMRSVCSRGGRRGAGS